MRIYNQGKSTVIRHANITIRKENKDGQPLYGLNNKLLQINFVKIVNADY